MHSEIYSDKEKIQAAWQRSHKLLEDAVQITFRKQDFCVLLFPDASALFWGGFLTQVPVEDPLSGIQVVDVAPKPLGFVSGEFKGCKLNWAVLDKKPCDILCMCHRLSIVLAMERIQYFCDHRKLAYIFNPVACTATLSKSTSQRLLNWRTLMSEFSYVIRHISSSENHWGRLLSRRRSSGGATDSGKRGFGACPVYRLGFTDGQLLFPEHGRRLGPSEHLY